MRLCVLLVVLLLSDFALARGVQSLRARAASRIVQALGVQKVQQVVAATYLQQEKEAGLSKLYLLLASTAAQEMPDGKPSRIDSESPDSPDFGRPAWDKPRRGGSDGGSPDSIPDPLTGYL